MYKIFAIVAFLAAANAGPIDHHHGATSFSSFNNDHSSVQHVPSAPAPLKYAAPSYYQAPAVAKQTVPVYHSAPAVHQYSAPTVHQYSAPTYSHGPVVAKQVYAAPVTKYVAAPAYKEEEQGPAQYEFAYVIEDPHTGDFHSQQEHRDEHNVQGQYSLHEADGTVRIVKYSDDGHGFNAVVEKQGEPTPAPVAYKNLVAPQYNQYHH
ncbi:unnamed protein product [Ceutorhynchus assimilis]|uniref:Cuticle protein n=1 Tax=Ceutorhynchus assimilis TaxID=467358 RepID=A0A9N9QRE3_9CUCU|nr:unnamed protein product [Ceutorhynchus assimilis]